MGGTGTGGRWGAGSKQSRSRKPLKTASHLAWPTHEFLRSGRKPSPKETSAFPADPLTQCSTSAVSGVRGKVQPMREVLRTL